jgi:hypothetical protein
MLNMADPRLDEPSLLGELHLAEAALSPNGTDSTPQGRGHEGKAQTRLLRGFAVRRLKSLAEQDQRIKVKAAGNALHAL